MRRSVHKFCAVVAALASTHWPGRARAQVPPLQATLDAPAECGDARDFRRRIDNVLGGPADERMRGPMTVHAEVTPSDGHLVLRLSITSQEGGGVRELSGNHCGELIEAAALVVGLAVDPKAVDEAASRREQADGPPAGPQPEEAIRKGGPPTVQTERPHPHKPLTPSGYVGPLGVLEMGALPGVGAGVAVAGGVRLGRVAIEVGGAYLPPRFAPLSTDADKGGTVGLASGQLGLCYQLTPEGSVVAAEPCLGLEAGALVGSGSDLQTERDAVEPWLGATATARARVRLGGPISLAVAVQVAVPFAPRRFEATPETGEPEEIHATAAVSGRALVGFFVNFP